MNHNPLSIRLQPTAKLGPIRSRDIPIAPPMERERTTREAPPLSPPIGPAAKSVHPPVDDFPTQPYSRSVGVSPTFLLFISASQFFRISAFTPTSPWHLNHASPARNHRKSLASPEVAPGPRRFFRWHHLPRRYQRPTPPRFRRSRPTSATPASEPFSRPIPL